MIILFIVAIAALTVALVAFSRGREANERVDDCMRYISDLRNNHGGEIKELHRELNRLKVVVRKTQGELDELPYEISDACVSCGTCETECLEEAIKDGEIYRIDPDLCNSCGTCEDVCPVDACAPMQID